MCLFDDCPYYFIKFNFVLCKWRVAAERLRAPDSSSGVCYATWRVATERLRAPDKALVFDQQSVGSNPGRDTCYVTNWGVVLSALPARLRIDDTQAYIRTDCKRGNPVSALGVGGNGLWEKKIIVAHTLNWSFRPCVSGNLNNFFFFQTHLVPMCQKGFSGVINVHHINISQRTLSSAALSVDAAYGYHAIQLYAKMIIA